jgi:hypothetical protein
MQHRSSPDYITPSGKVYEELWDYCKQRIERPLDLNILGMKLKEARIERRKNQNLGNDRILLHRYKVPFRAKGTKPGITLASLQR